VAVEIRDMMLREMIHDGYDYATYDFSRFLWFLWLLWLPEAFPAFQGDSRHAGNKKGNKKDQNKAKDRETEGERNWMETNPSQLTKTE